MPMLPPLPEDAVADVFDGNQLTVPTAPERSHQPSPRSSLDFLPDGTAEKVLPHEFRAAVYGIEVGGEFYGPRIIRGAWDVGDDTLTIRSEMSCEEDKRPGYRSLWAIGAYGLVILVVIVLATVMGVVYG